MGETQPAAGQAPAALGAARRFRVALPAAMVLGVLALMLMAVSVALSGLAHQLSVLGTVPTVVVGVAFGGVGVVVARRQPGNPIGWILLAVILMYLFSTAVGTYAVLYYSLGHRGLPLAPVAVLLEPLWHPAVLLVPLVLLLFPDGRLAWRRWRWVLGTYAVLGACATAASFSPAIAAVASHDIHLDSSGEVISQGHAPGGPAAAAQVLVLAAIGAIWLSFLARQALSWRRAGGERRQQLKWLAYGAAIALVFFAVYGAVSTVSSTSVLYQLLSIAPAALPVAIGIGILKYRLYDIDRIISRTLAYAIVTGLLVGVYAGLVLLATQVLGVRTPVAVAAATLAAAALFNPVRRRVQQAVDRRFNRARYDADRTVAAFAARLNDAVDPDAVRADLAGVVHQALEPTHLSVWISQPD